MFKMFPGSTAPPSVFALANNGKKANDVKK
jgi:hypothetical protein